MERMVEMVRETPRLHPNGESKKESWKNAIGQESDAFWGRIIEKKRD